MPAVSEKQRKLAGIALSMKRGKTPKDYSHEAWDMARSMSLKELEKYAAKPLAKG